MYTNVFRIFREPVLGLVLLALLAAAAGLVVIWPDRPAAAPPVPADPVALRISQIRQQLDRVPGNAAGWADLGGTYVESARITGDPGYYGRAQQALDESLRLRPEGNAEAELGLGALANARHDFATARGHAGRALAVRPASADGYGVLVDALTQLGDAEGATAAVQRMLELRPGVPSFTRAAYDLELHGRVDEARAALELALTASSSADQVAFCRYHLGELAFNAGDLDAADEHYRGGLLANPDNSALRQGRAKVSAARGDLDRAIREFTELTARSPLPEYLIEFGELLEAAGRPEAAAETYRSVAEQFRRLAEQGATEYVDASKLAADHGDPAEAVRLAELEYGRRQSVITADTLAWALHRAGRDGDAIGIAERANALGWRNATLAYHRGMILAGLGRTEEAAGALTDALRTNPYFSPLHAPHARQALDALGTR
ncbi:tetratricopeptide (TPR) repeat protein [Nocardia transvalensis]|uniref:Tetratricopeptide (TPR) repeat protein n=1 Tax=Nocardia transvalensis TaxID=37333 RepID=A0A7W9PIJ4_9NOCA|nr:tetratricopeptide repeat protein [Nocardia transvalensis]MBB5916540.1 tetratricopeptide (TPR) repeat protein [Nocardia transvalensis]